MKRFQFDTVMFPINFVEFYKRGYCQPVLEEAQRRGMGILAIKPMSLGSWPKDAQKSRQWWYRTPEEQEDVNLAMNFTLSQDSVIAGIPPSYLDLTNKAIVAAGSLKVPSKQELEKMKDISALSISQFQEQERKAAMGGHRIDYFDLSSGRNTRKPV
jgi:predicted aldo/keto reductase-like oxidoreductase